MNFHGMLKKGPFVRNTKVGKKGSYTRVGLSRHFRPIIYATIDYTPIESERRYLLPWVKNTKTVVWRLATTLHCNNGRKLVFHSIAEGDIDDLLEYAYTNGLNAAVKQLTNEREHQDKQLRNRNKR